MVAGSCSCNVAMENVLCVRDDDVSVLPLPPCCMCATSICMSCLDVPSNAIPRDHVCCDVDADCAVSVMVRVSVVCSMEMTRAHPSGT